ncbi:NADH dehydrogenase subunit M [Stackebrandtia albiflava]|uniref:NADH dehydrogenase subunit M n=1 Tax=Stackebrandtia albiflava TaxID=406432 RepID=A0A562UXV4_9ACTN|nr:NADH-quinone oxidoreductase subunit M [Stackebrandtia albiflava]TWJ10437.1 NADH dehydrogenase subunit M [Stackebrandtia albiflava]
MTAVLIAVLALPAAGGVLAALGHRHRSAGWLATGFAAAGLLAAVFLPASRGDGPLWHRFDVAWAPAIGLRFDIGVDGISYPLIVLTALLTLLCCLHTMSETTRRPTALIGLLLAVEVGILGVFLAANIVAFFVFFEIVLLPMYAIIAFWGGPGRRAAAAKFALYTVLGSLLLLVGVYVVVSSTGTGDLVALAESGGGGMSPATQLVAFALLGVGFAVKSPLWPLHSWLPAAHTEAPTVGSVILAGVLLKMGTYGLIRVGLGVAPEGAHAAAPVLLVLAVAAIVVGGLICLAQRELKRLIAYSSVGHMGFVLLGIATLSGTGITAALYGNIAHGLITGLLFFLVGSIKQATGHGMLTELGGLRTTAPGLAGILGFAALASLGLPGLAGFWGEAFAVYATLAGDSTARAVAAAVAAAGAALAAAYLLRMIRRVNYGPPTAAVDGAAAALRVTPIRLALWGPLVAATVLLGVVPGLLLDGFTAAPFLEWVSR